MSTFYNRLNKALSVLKEQYEETDWKNPRSSSYRRDYAEDCLFHTVGPLTANPTWSTTRWVARASGMAPPEGYAPGGPAPRWTEEEVLIAYAGDPSKMFKGGPTSPAGSPLMRLALKISRGGKRTGRQEIADNYQNGLTELVKLMKPGRDASRSPFIGWVTRTIEGAVKHGVGTTSDVRSGITTMRAMLTARTPSAIEAQLSEIGDAYREYSDRRYDRNPENVFGYLTPTVYEYGSNLIAAMNDSDEEEVARLKSEIATELDRLEVTEHIPGATTGAFSAISTKDRETKLGQRSIDMPMGDDGLTIGETLPSVADDLGVYIDQDAVSEILKIGLTVDLADTYGTSPDFGEFLSRAGAGLDDVRGPLTADEYRVLLRSLGTLAAKYPGRGNQRVSLQVPRDAAGWWKPGEDPEIEPIQSGGIWKSTWLKTGMRLMSIEDMVDEFKNEVAEFKELGIETARKSEIEAKSVSFGDTGVISGRDLEMYNLAVAGVSGAEIARRFGISKQNVSNRLKKLKSRLATGEVPDLKASVISTEMVAKAAESATRKMKLISEIYSEEIGLSESIARDPLFESYNKLDRKLLSEAAMAIGTYLSNRLAIEYARGYKTDRPTLADLYNQHKMKMFV